VAEPNPLEMGAGVSQPVQRAVKKALPRAEVTRGDPKITDSRYGSTLEEVQAKLDEPDPADWARDEERMELDSLGKEFGIRNIGMPEMGRLLENPHISGSPELSAAVEKYRRLTRQLDESYKEWEGAVDTKKEVQELQKRQKEREQEQERFRELNPESRLPKPRY